MRATRAEQIREINRTRKTLEAKGYFIDRGNRRGRPIYLTDRDGLTYARMVKKTENWTRANMEVEEVFVFAACVETRIINYGRG